MAARVGEGRVLSGRALNRALLARQFLLGRVSMPPREMIAHLVGMQSQVPTDPYQALWSRIDGFDPHELGRLMTDRRVLRAGLMRGTIHLVTAEDCLALRPFVQRLYDAVLVRKPWAAGIRGVDRARLAARARAFLDGAPRTAGELRDELARRWPDNDAASLAHAVHALVPTVQVTPRGVWGRAGRPMWTTVESWLGRPVPDAAPAGEIALRYLAAFGPASVMDLQAWAGVTRLKPVIEELRPGLATFRDEAGRELFDLPDAPRPDPDTPAPVRFLPTYDNVLLGHADRTRLVSDELRRALAARNPDGYDYGTVLVDGRVAATWRIEADRAAARLIVFPIEALDPVAGEVGAEAGRLLEFSTPDASRREVEWREPWR
ncbi:MAG: winged helix DNA-binding domain-containing protein [Thermoleophilia bacterium]